MVSVPYTFVDLQFLILVFFRTYIDHISSLYPHLFILEKPSVFTVALRLFVDSNNCVVL